MKLATKTRMLLEVIVRGEVDDLLYARDIERGLREELARERTKVRELHKLNERPKALK